MGKQTQKFLIVKDRFDIYRDFAINLAHYIVHYYIDYESINDDEQMNNHYNWCYDKVCAEFEEEGLCFRNNDILRKYFYTYYYQKFYTAQDNPDADISLEYFLGFWELVFDYRKKKHNGIVDIMVEIFNVFEKSINKRVNVFEYI
jgi:hypothetical protein